MLEILLFGSFEARRDGRSLCSRWVRHSDRLLALLTLNSNRALGCDWICASLGMPDQALPQGLHELYTLLAQDKQRIQHANRQVYFNAQGIQVDTLTFEKLIEKGTLGALEEAVAIHRGGLLKDWEEEGWFVEEREACLVSFLDAVDTLSRGALRDNDLDRAASFLRRYVAAYPKMDSAWARLIEIYSRAGNTSLIRNTQENYLEAIRNRSIEEGQDYLPSTRVIRACEQALQSSVSFPAPVATNPPVVSAVDISLLAINEETPDVSEPVGGMVPLGSSFYLSRKADLILSDAITRKDSFILVKGARQVGKSSLLARALHQARESGAAVVRTDWQKTSQSSLEDAHTFLLDLADTITDYLDLDIEPGMHFNLNRPATKCFERFIRKQVLPSVPRDLVWIIDEADRLFESTFRNDIFAMLRSWHGERANDLSGQWSRLTVILAYATEAHLFITDLNQSPFNIGTRLELDDFSSEQVGEMNKRYKSPLQTEEDFRRFYALLGGHPYLVRRCLQEMIVQDTNFDTIERAVLEGSASVFSDHLERMRNALLRDPEVTDTLRALLNGKLLPPDYFLRLRAAGVLRGSSPVHARFRCGLYENYFRGTFL